MLLSPCWHHDTPDKRFNRDKWMRHEWSSRLISMVIKIVMYGWSTECECYCYVCDVGMQDRSITTLHDAMPHYHSQSHRIGRRFHPTCIGSIFCLHGQLTCLIFILNTRCWCWSCDYHPSTYTGDNNDSVNEMKCKLYHNLMSWQVTILTWFIRDI